MRTLTFSFSCCGEVFPASVVLPDKYFDERGRPRWNLLTARFSNPNICWDNPIGGVQPDDGVVNQPQEIPPIGDELQKLREVVVSLEQKFTR